MSEAVEQPANDQEHRDIATGILNAAQIFIADAEALQELFEVAAPVLVAKAQEYRAELVRLTKGFSRGPENEVRMNLAEFHRLNRLTAKQTRGHFLFRGHLLVALVSRFDTFIASVARQLLTAFPARLSKKSISYADAAQFSDLDELKRKIIEDEVDEQMRGSHKDQLDFLSSITNVPLGADEPELLAQFIELTERRNCHIHSSGVASPQYLRMCSKFKVKFKEGPEEGQRLNVTVKYLDSSKRVLSEMAFKIAQTVVRKVFNESKGLADAHVNELGLQMLKDRRNHEALMMFDFAVKLKGDWAGDEVSRRIFVINKAQTLARLGKSEDAINLIEKWDWSAAHPKFLLAISTIKGDYPRAAMLMSEAAISEEYYRDWPLFDKFRQTDDFKSAFRALFNRDFDQAALTAATQEMAKIDSGESIFGASETSQVEQPQTQTVEPLAVPNDSGPADVGTL